MFCLSLLDLNQTQVIRQDTDCQLSPLSNALFFFLLGSCVQSMAPETIGPSGLCVRVKGRRVKRQRESGAGSWVKGGADPGGSRGVVVAGRCAGGLGGLVCFW